jgi:TonB family protein
MSNNTPILAISLLETTVHAARISSGKLEGYREALLEDKPGVEGLLKEVTPDWQSSSRMVFGFAAEKGFYHLSTPEQARQHRTKDAIAALAKGLPHGLSGALRAVACSAADGSAVQAKGDARWLLAAAEESAWAKAGEAFGAPVPAIGNTHVAGLAGLGALSGVADSGVTLCLGLGLTGSHLFAVSRKGVEGLVPVALSFDQIYEAVQQELGLKFKGSAARLFHNAQYDFTDFGPKIAARVAPALQSSLKSLPTGANLSVLGLLAGQQWFAAELAKALGLAPWSVEPSLVSSRFKVQLPADLTASALTPALLGTLQLGLSVGSSPAWVANWETSVAEPAPAPAPAPVPVAKPATPAPTPTPKPVEVAPAAKATPAPAPVAKPAAQPAQAAKTTPAPAPAAKPTPAPVAAKKEEAKPVAKKEEPKPAAPVAAAKKEEAKPASVLAYPGSEKKKSSKGLYIGLAAGAAVVIAVGVLLNQLSAEKAEVAKANEAKEKFARDAALQQQRNELKAKADAERIAKEAELARETAVAKAKEEAEQRVRQTVTEELNRKFMAESPGVLLVTTEPTGAMVSIDGGISLRSPVTRTDLKPGAHKVRISLDGYDDIETVADITALKTTDLGMIHMLRQASELNVTSSPSGMDYVITSNGEVVSQGKTPANLPTLPVGDYSISVQRPGWPRYVQSISLKKGGSERINADFPTGSVVIRSTPSNADVLRNGVKIGVTPYTLSDMPPGRFELSLDMKGYDRTPVQGEVVAGKEQVLATELLDPNRVAKSSEILTQPEAVEREAPRPIANPSGASLGKVIISAVVRKDGKVTNVKVDSAVNQEFAQSCAEAVSSWRFKPGLDHSGKPLNVRILIPFTAQ